MGSTAASEVPWASRERACSAVLSAAWVDTRAPRRVCRVCCPAASGHKVGRYRRSVDSLKVILTGEHLFAYYPNMPETPSATTAAVVCTEVDGLSAALCELAGHIHAATAELVRLLGRLDAIDGWQGVGIRSLGHWASIYLGIDLRTASLQAKVGRQLEELPAIAAAATAGELGWSKLRLVAQVAEPESDKKWLELAREMSVGQLARVVGAYRRAAETDDPDRSENHRERRGIWLFDEPDGLVRVTGLLEPDDAAVLRAGLAAQGERLWRHDGNDHTGDDPAETGADHPAAPARSDVPANDTAARPTDDAAPSTPTTGDPDDATTGGAASDAASTAAGAGVGAGAAPPPPVDAGAGEPAWPSEVDPTLAARDPVASRRVDAFVAPARAPPAARDRPHDGGDLPQDLLVVDHDVLSLHAEVGRSQLHNGPAIASHTARRLCCDARIRPLGFRDGPGCAFPGCTARHVDAHHLVFWDDGGATDLANLCLLCRHHHRLLHEGGYTATLIDGHPRFYRPDGTPIRPPDPPPPDPSRGTTHLRPRPPGAGGGPPSPAPPGGAGGAPSAPPPGGGGAGGWGGGGGGSPT